MSENESIELSREAANALANYFGFQQWLSPNSLEGRMYHGILHVSAIYELAEEMGAVGAGEDGVFADEAQAVKHIWREVFPDVEYYDRTHEAAQTVLEEYPMDDVHPVVEAYLAGVPVSEKGREAMR